MGRGCSRVRGYGVLHDPCSAGQELAAILTNLATDAEEASLVRTIIDIGRSLHIRVVAEVVEGREQLLLFEEHQHPVAQGYHVSRPLQAESFAEFLRLFSEGSIL